MAQSPTYNGAAFSGGGCHASLSSRLRTELFEEGIAMASQRSSAHPAPISTWSRSMANLTPGYARVSRARRASAESFGTSS